MSSMSMSMLFVGVMIGDDDVVITYVDCSETDAGGAEG
jgi:hypothetical protein